MSDNPQRLTRFDADGARIPQVPCYGTTLNGTALSRNGRREMASAVRAGIVSGDTGRVHGPRCARHDSHSACTHAIGPHGTAGPSFTPTDRQRRRIAGARAYIAQRLVGAYTGELDTGTVHGPERETITIRVEDTPSGRLLARALEIMRDTGCTMGEAMDRAR